MDILLSPFYQLSPGRLFCEPEKIWFTVEFHQICDDPRELGKKRIFIIFRINMALQRQTYAKFVMIPDSWAEKRIVRSS